MLNKIKINQQKIIFIEEQQNKFSNSISGTLTSLLQKLTETISERPCLLKQVDDSEVLGALIKTLEEKNSKIKANE
jgi:hypothetical protein